MALPQRIRAGYDAAEKLDYQRLILCHSAFARVTTLTQNTFWRISIFATAHSRGLRPSSVGVSAIIRSLPQRIRVGYDAKLKNITTADGTLPQRIRAGYDAAVFVNIHTCDDLCHSAFARVTTAEKQCSALRICCEKVDSFSSVGESGLALTIFPFSFAAKATYVAINDSFGRAIDRFFWCEPHRN